MAIFLANLSFQVRGLPCGHYFHVACIDKWLRLNMNCPRCRCTVFANFQLINLPGITPNHRTLIIQQAESQPVSHSYLSRMQSFLMPIRSGAAESSDANADANGNGNNNAGTNTNTNANTNTNLNAITSANPNINNASDVALQIIENGDHPSEGHDLHTSEERVQ